MMALIKRGIQVKFEEISDLSEAENILSKNTYIVLDTETAKTETYTGKYLLGCALGVPVGADFWAWYVDLDGLKQLWPVIQDKELIMHNAGFDLIRLQENDLTYSQRFWDTMIMTHLADENLRSYELDMLGLQFFQHRKMNIAELEKAFGGWEKIPFVGMGQYAINDLHITWKLFLKSLSSLQDQGLLDTVWTESMKYVRALMSTVREGLVIDWQLLDQLQTEAQLRMEELEERIGFPPGKRNPLLQRLYGLPSEDGLGLRPPSYTSKGKPSADVAAIKTLAERYPQHQQFFDDLQEWRKKEKEVSVWYKGFKLRNSEGLLHPGLKQHGTKTGRLSCAEPNLQQIPREKSRVKKLFKAKPGTVLVEADYSQIELRIGAMYAAKFGDSHMKELYLQETDVHHVTSELVGSYKTFPNNPKEGRQVGKEGNFLWIYGGGAARLAYQLNNKYRIKVSTEQCQVWTEEFHRNYPGFREAIRYYSNQSQQRGYISYWNGRRRRIKDRNERNQIKHHIAFNSIVQGGAGQILMYTMNRIHKAQNMDYLRSRMCNTVHDSIWFYVPEDNVYGEIEKIKELMRYIPKRVFAPMPFEVDVSILDPE